MKMTEFAKKYGDLESSVEQLKASVVVVDSFERCEEGELYYYISPFYRVFCTSEDGYSFDDIYHAIGNYYPEKHWTEEEIRVIAERKKKKAIAEAKVNRRIKELNEGWVPNWDDGNEAKFFMRYKRDIAAFTVACVFVSSFNTNIYYCKSREIAEQIIDEMEDELEIIFEVE